MTAEEIRMKHLYSVPHFFIEVWGYKDYYKHKLDKYESTQVLSIDALRNTLAMTEASVTQNTIAIFKIYPKK